MTKSCLVIGDLNVDLVLNELKGFPELGKEIVARNHYHLILTMILKINGEKKSIGF